MTAEEWKRVFANLVRARAPIDEIRAEGPGIYAIFLSDDATIPRVEPGLHRLIYMGESDDLHERLRETHFKTGKTGFSTLRRTLGALMKSALELHAVPRGKTTKPEDGGKFQFRLEDEKRLTYWMVRSLRVATAAGADLQEEEPEFVREFQPPLNRRGWQNPLAEMLDGLLEACRAEALNSIQP